MKEWHRTVLLIIILLAAVGFLLWQQGQYQNNFLNTL